MLKPEWLRVKAPQRERIGAVADLLVEKLGLAPLIVCGPGEEPLANADGLCEITPGRVQLR